MRCCDPILPQTQTRPICEPLVPRSLVSSRAAFVVAMFLSLSGHIWRKSSRPALDLIRRKPTSGFPTSSTRQRRLWTTPARQPPNCLYGYPPYPAPYPVSYTHLTLLTNRKV